MKLTDSTARDYRPNATDTFLWDDDLKGFGLRVRGERRVWICQYRIASTGQQRRITIGAIEEKTAIKARREADRILASAEDQIDAQVERRQKRLRARAAGASDRAKAQLAAARAKMTLGAVGAEYLTFKSTPPKDGRALRESSLADIKRHLEIHWRPLRNYPIRDITQADVAKQLDTIAHTRGQIAANRARTNLSSFYSWAVARGFADANPVAKTEQPKKEAPRERVLDDGEIAEIWHAAEGEGEFGAIIRILILTMARRSEASGPSPDEIDVADRMWTLPAERSKNHRPLKRPLSDPALEILKPVLKARAGRKFLFGERDDSPFSGFSKATKALNAKILKARKARLGAKAMGLDWTLHDLRRTGATCMQRLGVPVPVIEACLGHVSGTFSGIVGVYQRHDYEDEKREAFGKLADHVLGIAAAGEAPAIARTA